MSFTHKIDYVWTGGNLSDTSSKSYTETGATNITLEIATGQTDVEVVCALDVSELVSFFISSDQDIRFEGNNNAGADFQIDLIANVPYIWHTDAYDTNLLGAVDVTSFFLTNASGSTATFKLRALYDTRPA